MSTPENVREHDDKAIPCNCSKCLYTPRPGRTYAPREAAL